MSGARVRDRVPRDLEEKLKTIRLDLLALYRAIDEIRMDAREVPWPLLEVVAELDGDLAQALAILDHSALGYDVRRMVRDTHRSMKGVPPARERFLAALPSSRRAALLDMVRELRATLTEQDAWHSIPGKDPFAGRPR